MACPSDTSPAGERDQAVNRDEVRTGRVAGGAVPAALIDLDDHDHTTWCVQVTPAAPTPLALGLYPSRPVGTGAPPLVQADLTLDQARALRDALTDLIDATEGDDQEACAP